MAKRDMDVPVEMASLVGAKAAQRFRHVEPRLWLRALRRWRKMSQTKLGRKVGLTQAEISRIENGAVLLRKNREACGAEYP